MKYRLAIFDLDGTILSTLEDLAAAVNHALRENAMPERTVDEVRRFVGNGVEKLIRRAVPAGADEAAIMKVLEDFRAYYNVHSNDHTGPYPGISEMMKKLRSNGVFVAIHSNKYDAAVQKLCALHFPGMYDHALGEGALSPKKPDPQGAFSLMRMCGVEAKDAIYIGDSEVDLMTAQNAGIDVAWVSWGFRKESELPPHEGVPTFDSAESLTDFLI